MDKKKVLKNANKFNFWHKSGINNGFTKMFIE